MKKFITLIGLLSLCFMQVVMAQQSEFSEQYFVHNNDTLKYRQLLPKNFDASKTYPLVLFLHGAGERGSDNKSQLVHGSKLFLESINRGAFPAVVIFPQCPKNDYWSNATVDRSTKPISLKFPIDQPATKSLNLVSQLVDTYLEKTYIDKGKIYVGGLSMGGMGTYEILYRKPNTFAAAFAICGGGNPETVKAYANTTALWVFHGAKDDVVNPQLSMAMVKAYLEAGGTPNVTIYEAANHNSWDPAFAEPKLLPWLFSKTKN